MAGSERAVVVLGLAVGGGAGFAIKADFNVSGGTTTPASKAVDRAVVSSFLLLGSGLGAASVMVAAIGAADATSAGAMTSLATTEAGGRGGTSVVLDAAEAAAVGVWLGRLSKPQAIARTPRPRNSNASHFFLGFETTAERSCTVPRMRVWSASPTPEWDNRLGLEGLGFGGSECCKMYIPRLLATQDF